VNDHDKEIIQKRYQEEKARGVKFFPDIIYKDAIVAFSIFILLVGLAMFVGVPQEPPADPSDASYVPRPEWYFLFLFEMLKFFPGRIEFIGTVLIPGIAIFLLLLLPFYDRHIKRHPRNRPIATIAMSAIVVGIVALTIRAVITTPPQAEAVGLTYQEKVAAGQELYVEHCAECHGEEGEGGLVEGVEGLEGTYLEAINSEDYLYTRTDETTYNVVEYGQPNLGMPAFGLAYGGELSMQQINAIVTFVRSWDDRIIVEEEEVAIPALAEGEIPDYETHVSPILRRRCLSCHREGKAKGNYIMSDYQSVMTSGDYAPNVIGGDLGSNFIRMINREEIEAGGPMPPTRPLRPEEIDIITRWVEAGALPARAQPTPGIEATEGITGTLEAPGVEATQGITGTLEAPGVEATQGITGTLEAPGAEATQGITGTLEAPGVEATQGITGTLEATESVTVTVVPAGP
jgi:mono/diheme cytochrome c family protein